MDHYIHRSVVRGAHRLRSCRGDLAARWPKRSSTIKTSEMVPVENSASQRNLSERRYLQRTKQAATASAHRGRSCR
jgi:hypothetical protein